jgi:hypothetical protein
MKPILIAILLCCWATDLVFAQQNTETKLLAKYDGGDILLSYQLPAFNGTDSLSIAIYRTGRQGDEVLIKQNLKEAVNAKFLYADTTLRKHPGIYQYRLQISAVQTVLREEKALAYAFAPDEIPMAVDFDAKNRKGTKNINLNWKIANNYLLSNIIIERSRKQDGAFAPVATLNQTDSVFVDQVSDANEPYFYRLGMENVINGKIYYATVAHVTPQFAIVPLSVTNVKAAQMRERITLSWENQDDKANGFYILKRSGKQDTFLLASAKILKNGTDKYRWTDSASTLVNNEMYQYSIVAESNSFDKSKPSDTVTIAFSRNIPALSPPQHLQVVTANDTTYSLVWQVDSLRQNEIAGYAVYIKDAGSTVFKALVDGVVTSNINYVAIPKPKNGDTYQVRAVNGSKQSTPSTAYTYTNAFEREFGPKYLKAAVMDQTLKIKWLKPENVQVRAYKLYKWNGKGFDLIATIPPDQDTVATKNYLAGDLNMYQLKTVNSQGIESKGSKVLQVN